MDIEKKPTEVPLKPPNVIIREDKPSLMKEKHPRLAKLYEQLNTVTSKLHILGPRSASIKMQLTNEVEELRKKIKEYKKNEGITREEEMRLYE